MTVSVDLKDWVVWPKNTFQNMLDEQTKKHRPVDNDKNEDQLTAEETDAAIKDLSEIAFSISKDFAKKIYNELPRDRFSYLIEWDQSVSAQQVLMSHIWRDVIEYAKYQYFIVRDIFSYVFANHLNRVKISKREAIGSIVTRSLLVFREIVSLCEAGYADGAIARWRTLYELQVTLAAINAIGGRSYELFVASEAVGTLRYMDALEKRKGGSDSIEGINVQMHELQVRHGKQICDDFGWAAICLEKKRVNFRDIEQIARHDFQRPEYKYASRLIHGNHLEYVSLLGYPEWSGAHGPLIGPSPYGVEIALQEAVKTMTFIAIEVSAVKNTLDTMILLNIAMINKNKFDGKVKKAVRSMDMHTHNINNNWGR